MTLMLALTHREVSTRVGKEVKTGQLSAGDLAGRVVDGSEKLRLVQINYGLGPVPAGLWVIGE